MKDCRHPALAFMACVIFFGAAARADLFSVSAQTTSGPPQTVTSSGNNLSDVVTSLINNQNQFSTLANRDVSATLNYAGIRNAITITKNAPGTMATVQIPSIGLNKTFTGSDTNALKDQIINYVKRNGASEYGKFLRQVNESSASAGVADGNPLSATAILADHQFFTFGLHPAPFRLGESDQLDSVATPRLRFDASGGVADTHVGSEYFVRGAFEWGFRFNDRIGLVLSNPFL